MPLLDALAEFLAAKRAAGLSPATTSWYAIQISSFHKWLEGQPGDWFAPSRFEQYYVYLADQRGLQPSSIRGAHRALNVFFRWLLKRKMIMSNPLNDVALPRVPKHQPRRTTPDQYEELLRSIALAGNWIDARDYLLGAKSAKIDKELSM